MRKCLESRIHTVSPLFLSPGQWSALVARIIAVLYIYMCTMLRYILEQLLAAPAYIVSTPVVEIYVVP
jgi:hypothetical protein